MTKVKISFNPFSQTFRNAQKVFYGDLSQKRQMAAVVASVFGGVFFIVGGIGAFCFAVKILQPKSKNPTVSSDPIEENSAKVQKSVSEVLPITKKKEDYSDYYIVKGPRFREDLFNKFVETQLKDFGLNFKLTSTDPGLGQKVIVLDFWGRAAGELPIPFPNCQASLIHVIICDKLDMEFDKPALVIKWNSESPFHNNINAEAIKKFLKPSEDVPSA